MELVIVVALWVLCFRSLEEIMANDLQPGAPVRTKKAKAGLRALLFKASVRDPLTRETSITGPRPVPVGEQADSKVTLSELVNEYVGISCYWLKPAFVRRFYFPVGCVVVTACCPRQH